MPSQSVERFYVRKLRRVLGRRRRLVGFLAAAGVHAVGHAVVALVAGALALSLTGRFGSVPSGGLLGGGAGPAVGAADHAAHQAIFLSVVGLAVVLAKGVAGAYATYVQARVAGEVGGSLRLELLDSILAVHALHRPRQDDHGGAAHGAVVSRAAAGGVRAVSALTDRVRDIESGLEQGFLGGARAVAQIVPVGALLVFLSPKMALAAALVLAPFGWLLGRVRGGYRRATQRAAREREDLLAAADEAVRHADLWVTFGAAAKARETARRLGEAIALGSARLQARAAAASGANEVLGALALVLAVLASRAGWGG